MDRLIRNDPSSPQTEFGTAGQSHVSRPAPPPYTETDGERHKRTHRILLACLLRDDDDGASEYMYHTIVSIHSFKEYRVVLLRILAV